MNHDALFLCRSRGKRKSFKQLLKHPLSNFSITHVKSKFPETTTKEKQTESKTARDAILERKDEIPTQVEGSIDKFDLSI